MGSKIGTVPQAGAPGQTRAMPSAPAEPIKSLLKQRRAEILRDTAVQLLRGDDPDGTVLPTLFRTLAAERLIDASLGFVVTESGTGLEMSFIKGFPEHVIAKVLTLDFGQAICGTVAATRRGMHVTDIQRSLDPLADLVRSAGITAYVSEPLIAGDQLLGTLSFASRTRRRFDADDILFFRSIAKYVAIARDRAEVSARAGQPRRSSLPPETPSK